MTSAEILRAFAGAERVPAAALSAAVDNPSLVAPRVIELLGMATEGVCLIPDEEDAVYFGLHALAAARYTDACPAFVAWMRRRSESDSESLLGDRSVDIERQVLLGLFDGNADALFSALEDPTIDGDARWTLFVVLSRLVWDGVVDRTRLITLIQRFDREAMAPPGDWAWYGWQDAIMHLGLETMRDRVRRAWAGPLSDFDEVDREEWLECLAFAVAHPDDPDRFVDAGAIPMGDPVEMLSRFEPREGMYGNSLSVGPVTNPTQRELDWLSRFLASQHVSLDAMDLEMLDGFLTALAVGPVSIPFAEYVREIWDTENGESPSWSSPEQERFATDVVQRYAADIVRQFSSDSFRELLVDPDDEELCGYSWALGFSHAVQLRFDSWAPVLDDPHVGAILTTVFVLTNDGSNEDGPVLTGTARDDVTTALPMGLKILREYWGDPKGVSRRLAAATPKVGRNTPCPCGSGRKFKKCCGAH